MWTDDHCCPWVRRAGKPWQSGWQRVYLGLRSLRPDVFQEASTKPTLSAWLGLRSWELSGLVDGAATQDSVVNKDTGQEKEGAHLQEGLGGLGVTRTGAQGERFLLVKVGSGRTMRLER